jgi:hypothetical protein
VIVAGSAPFRRATVPISTFPADLLKGLVAAEAPIDSSPHILPRCLRSLCCFEGKYDAYSRFGLCPAGAGGDEVTDVPHYLFDEVSNYRRSFRR